MVTAVASKILVVSAEYPKMFQWKCCINLKATNIPQMQSKPFLTVLRLVCVVCFKKKFYIYIYTHVYISKKTLKSHSWFQIVQWISTQWICMKESGDQWMRPSLGFDSTFFFFYKGSWHGVLRITRVFQSAFTTRA